MSCIYQVCLVHSFEGELCFLIHFWLQHYIVLDHVIGMQHWITHKQMKVEFWCPLYIRGICHTYTAAVHIHGIYMVYTGIYRLYTSSGFQMHTMCRLYAHFVNSHKCKQEQCALSLQMHTLCTLYMQTLLTPDSASQESVQRVCIYTL